MVRWDVTIQIDEDVKTYSNVRVTIGHDTVKLHHDRHPSTDEVAAFVSGNAETFLEATEEMWVDSCLVADDALVLVGTELTGGAGDIKGVLRMKWTIKPSNIG
jgi:hypothetical protein